MQLNASDKKEIMKQAVEIAKAYAGSPAQNKVSIGEVIEEAYKKIFGLLEKA